MPKFLRFIVVLFVSGLTLSQLTSCQNNPTPQGEVRCTNDKAMKKALQGSWILREYADSVDAGLTPKVLEYLLEREHSIDYSGTGNDVHVAYASNNIEKTQEVTFDYKGGKLFFLEKDTQVAWANFRYDTGDTILTYTNDSAPDRPIEFLKYDMSKCPRVLPFMHLVNSKFITGKYYNTLDNAYSRHIILTKCGNVEGAANISEALQKATYYEVQLGKFGAESDAITFMDDKNNGIAQMNWSISKDSLILTSGKGKPIVLIKK